MKRRLGRLLRPGLGLYFVFLFAFCFIPVLANQLLLAGLELLIAGLIFAAYLLDRKGKVRYILRDADGRETDRLSWQHDFDAGNGEHYIQRYSRILPLLSSDELHRGKVLDADCVLMRARAVWQRGKEMLEREPFYFVDHP